MKTATLFTASTDALFRAFGRHVQNKHNPQKRFAYIPGTQPIVVVAHADTVQPPAIHDSCDGIVTGSGWDDRAGVYLCLRAHKDIGAHVLICDNEEKGASTITYAEEIIKTIDPLAIIEYDRAGDDCVTYDMDSKAFRKLLGKYYRLAHGTFSDISSVYDLGICACNIGIGYSRPHAPAPQSTLNLAMMHSQYATSITLMRQMIKDGKKYRFNATRKVGFFSTSATPFKYNPRYATAVQMRKERTLSICMECYCETEHPVEWDGTVLCRACSDSYFHNNNNNNWRTV